MPEHVIRFGRDLRPSLTRESMPNRVRQDTLAGETTMALTMPSGPKRQQKGWLWGRFWLQARQMAAGLALALASAYGVSSAAAQTSPVQTCQLGDLRLESGSVIPNVRMTYITHGTLNAERSNAIVSIHGLRGNRDAQSFLAGPGKALDTDRYFVI